MNRIGAGVLILLCLLAGAGAEESEMRLSPKPVRDEVRTVVESQLAALRRGEIDEAYALASAGIRRQFSARVFGQMLRRGYPPLLRNAKADLGIVRDDGEGTAQLAVTVMDGLNRSTAYRFWLVLEEEGWRINGVVIEQKPPRGDI